MTCSNRHLKPSRPMLLPARPRICTSTSANRCVFPKKLGGERHARPSSSSRPWAQVLLPLQPLHPRKALKTQAVRTVISNRHVQGSYRRVQIFVPARPRTVAVSRKSVAVDATRTAVELKPSLGAGSSSSSHTLNPTHFTLHPSPYTLLLLHTT